MPMDWADYYIKKNNQRNNYGIEKKYPKGIEEVNPTNGARIKIKAELKNRRYPASGHKSGEFAIATFRVIEVLEGTIPKCCDCDALDPDCIVTFKGPMVTLEHHEEYIIIGTLVEDSKWGYQFNIVNIHMNIPLNTPEEQRAFLSTFLTDNQITNLYEAFDNPIEILKNRDIQSLCSVKGIQESTATRMVKKYLACEDNAAAYVKLEDYGLTVNAINKLVAVYKSADVAIQRITEDPYMLIREVRGYGWKKADSIACAKGMVSNDPKRVKAFTEYYLQEQCEANGHSWMDANVLLTAVQNECQPLTDQEVVQYVKEMITEEVERRIFVSAIDSEGDSGEGIMGQVITEVGTIITFDPQTNRIGLRKYKEIEERIADNLHRLQTASNSIHVDPNRAETIIKQVEEEQGFEYTKEQKDAIWGILNNQVSILTGKAGCGKSFSVNAVVKTLMDAGYIVNMCALSGRASSKLGEITHLEGTTIHRLLKINPKNGRFGADRNNPLDCNMVILDEASMVGGDLFVSLLDAIPTGAKFLMVGDIAQLESIGMGNVLKDCISSGVISSHVLTKIHRQAAQSGIITESIRVSQGESPFAATATINEYRGELKDLKFTTYTDANLSQKKILDEYRDMYFNRHISKDDIQVIVPMRSRGNISCRALNEEIQKIVNGTPHPSEIKVNYSDKGVSWEVTYRPGDRIIIVNNNYRARSVLGNEVAIFNGNVGYIKSITNDGMIINLSEQGDIFLTPKQYKDIQLSYAITVHKKQGDSSPYVIVGLDTSCYALYSKELLYTAMSRARKFCSVVVQNTAFFAAVKISRISLKQTWLKDALRKLFFKNEE